jgi:dolichyl-phosphate beta-glucosyltransferase
MAPDLSIILPCFRSAAIALQSVAELRHSFDAAGLTAWEIIVVDDGGGDFPPAPWHPDDPIQLVVLPENRGKGAAVAAGMAAARGRARIYTDVDLPYGIELIPAITDYLCRRGFHMVIGDRTMASSVYHESIHWQRRIVSRLSAKLVGSVVTGGFFDTQCGLKGIRGDVADLLFGLVRIERFAFDIELIYVALLHRLDIKRLPVQLLANHTSSVRVFRDSLRAVTDILRIKHHQVRGAYESPALQELVQREIDEVCAGALWRAEPWSEA